jgi:Transglutaminase-like superfamily
VSHRYPNLLHDRFQRRLARLRRFEPAELMRIALYALLLLGVSCLLRFCGYRRTRAFLVRLLGWIPSGAQTTDHETKRRGELLETAALAALGGSSCLPQALVFEFLLVRRGFRPLLNLGVAHDRAAGWQAHAWVELGGRVVLGGAESSDRFLPMT